MPSSFIQSLVAFGLATLGTVGAAFGPAVGAELAPAGAGPEVVYVDGDASASRIDPALLNNATLRRALAMVGPDLVREPAIREAIRTGRFDESLAQHPAVQRAMLRVGPMLLADPELAAAVRSGELGPELISDPAVVSLLRGLDPTLFDDAPVLVTTDVEPTPASPVFTRPVVRPEPSESALRRHARHREAIEAHRAARRAQRAPRGVSAERRAELRHDARETARGLMGLAFGIAREIAASR